MHEAAAGDRYLLCTNVGRVVPAQTLREILHDEGDLQDAADRVAAMAFPAEQHGHLTCIVADVEMQPQEQA
jgi:serine/threonine protein phosphatase PrpC